jgi:uncharacterized protein (TIGR00299 family) protein
VNTLYLDLVGGISGDMFLGALLDLGIALPTLEHALRSLPIAGWQVHAEPGEKLGLRGTRLEVRLVGHADPHQTDEHAHAHDHAVRHRTFQDIETLIAASALCDWVKTTSTAVFRRLAVAEGKIHGRAPEQVHFHEVGAVDSVIDIVGACVALDWLGRPRLYASAVVDGTGWLTCAHGRYPLPAPATLEVLAARGATVSQCAEPCELVTPTGAALLAELVTSFGPMPAMPVTRIGYGLGQRDLTSRPNVLRVVLGQEAATASPSATILDWETDTVAVLETNLDDTTPELLGHFAEQALAAGALDVFHTPIQMKKGRPATLLTLLCAPADADRFTERLLRETTAFGVRRAAAERRKLRREFQEVPTAFGALTVKLGRLNDQIVQAAPEYESCRQAALKHQVPLPSVYDAAREAIGRQLGRPRSSAERSA